jgi:hypothetical protein
MPKRRNTAKHVAFGATSYGGPLTQVNYDSITVTLFDNATISASAGGSILANFGNNPSSAANWTEMSTSWDEYRVLGIKFSYDPNNVVNTATLSGFNGYNMIVHGPSTSSPGTLAGAASTGVAHRWNAFRRFTREWRMSEVAESTFIDTSSPTTTSDALQLYAVNGTATQYYGNILIEFLVQFRTHRF